MSQYKRGKQGMSSQTKWLIGGGIAAVAVLGLFAILAIVLIVKSGGSNDQAKKPSVTTAPKVIIARTNSNSEPKLEPEEIKDDFIQPQDVDDGKKKPNRPGLVETDSPDLNVKTAIPEPKETKPVETSVPPLAIPGKQYRFAIPKQPGFDAVYRLVKGPAGLSLGNDGSIVWDCPRDFMGNAEVVIEITTILKKEQYKFNIRTAK